MPVPSRRNCPGEITLLNLLKTETVPSKSLRVLKGGTHVINLFLLSFLLRQNYVSRYVRAFSVTRHCVIQFLPRLLVRQKT